MKLDILGLSVHPDDIELCASGTVLKHIALGYKVGIVDLTQGELGTRGSGALRLEEAQESAKILGLASRENLGLRDGFFEINDSNLIPIIRAIRKYQPSIILANAVRDRHPDHGRAAQLVEQASFLSGLVKVPTEVNGVNQNPWRPKVIYHYIQDYRLHPDLIVDITPYANRKMQSILAFKSQFFNPDSDEPDSPISGKDFLDYVVAADRVFGRLIGAEYGEGFTVSRPIGVRDLLTLD